MNIGFTGTRTGMTNGQCDALHELLALSYETATRCVFFHGGAIGADTQAHFIAKHHNWLPIVLPACGRPWTLDTECTVLAPLPPLVRNSQIVAYADKLFAAPKESTEQRRGGTWATVRRARKARISLVVIDPSGRVIEEYRNEQVS